MDMFRFSLCISGTPDTAFAATCLSVGLLYAWYCMYREGATMSVLCVLQSC